MSDIQSEIFVKIMQRRNNFVILVIIIIFVIRRCGKDFGFLLKYMLDCHS